MRAMVLEGGFGIDHLHLQDCPKPKPGPGELLIRMRALSLNFRDALLVRGFYNPKLRLPLVPVSDGCGEVEACGDGVEGFSRGDRVLGCFMQHWFSGPPNLERLRASLGAEVQGMAQEYVVLPASGVVRVPEHLRDDEAATLPCAALTAWNALMAQAQVRPGETVLCLGTGGVSLFALEFAKTAGARVIITSKSDDKLARAKKLGADEGINYQKHPDWDKAVLDITRGVGVDHVIEVGGAGTLPHSIKAVRVGGSIALIGILSGLGEWPNLTPILMKSIRLQGVFVGSKDMFLEMNRAMALHQTHPVVDRVFALEELGAALEYLESGQHFGKVVIRMAE